MVTVVDNYGFESTLSNSLIYIIIASVCVVLLAFYFLRSFGLYKLCVRNGVNNVFISFIPLLWLFVACKLIGNARIFNTTLKKLALVFTIIFSVSSLIILVMRILVYLPLVGYFFQGGDVIIFLNSSDKIIRDSIAERNVVGYVFLSDIYVGGNIQYPYMDPMGVRNAVVVLDTVASIISIFSTIVTFIVYVNLFRKFWPQHFILASLLSFFGFFAPFVFAIRNRPAISYEEYVRSRYSAYGVPPNGRYANRPEQNPFDGFENGNGNSANGEQNAKQQDPFEDFFDKDDKN